METKTVEKKKNGLVGIKGRWKLTYNQKNKENLFGGYGLSPYKNPRTGAKIPLIDVYSGRVIQQYMVDKLSKILNPSVPQDLKYIEWLIHHPEVWVEGYEDFGPEYKALKNPGARIKLIALDYQEMSEIEDEEYIDKLVGRIVQDGGVHAIGLEKLKVLLHSIGAQYRDSRYMRDTDKEKKFLRKTLKAFVRSSIKNAELVQKNLDEIDGLKNEYYISEMVRLKVFTHSGGSYRYKGSPLAVSTAKIAHVWESEPETRIEHIRAMELAQTEELR